MPILPAEPDMHPANLWEVTQPDSSFQRWWCLHTKPRQEKAIARMLRVKDISYYLPQALKVDRTPQGRKIQSVIPLFPSYLFLLGDDYARIMALRTDRLARVLEVDNQAALIHDLRQIHQVLASGLAVVPEPVMPVGARVRIKNGPLAGIVGMVVRRGKHDHFVAIVQFLGRGAAVELRDWQVERIDDESPLSMRA
jgi:transcription antitermination factor NusG